MRGIRLSDWEEWELYYYKVNGRWTNEQLAFHYGIPVRRVQRIIKKLGATIEQAEEQGDVAGDGARPLCTA